MDSLLVHTATRFDSEGGCKVCLHIHWQGLNPGKIKRLFLRSKDKVTSLVFMGS